MAGAQNIQNLLESCASYIALSNMQGFLLTGLAQQNHVRNYPRTTRTNRLSTPTSNILYDAVLSRKIKNVKRAIAAGASLEEKGPDGNTPLCLAVELKLEGIALALLDNNASITSINDMGRTALHLAVRNKQITIIKSLLDRGASPVTCDCAGESPLHLALKIGKQKILNLLKTVLTPEDVKKPRKPKKSDKETGTCHGIINLHHAVLSGDLKNVKRTIRKVAYVTALDERDPSGNTALCLAAQRGFEDIVSYLLDLNASVSAVNRNGMAALHLASLGGFKSIAQKLIEAGASHVTRDFSGASPFDLAVQAGHWGIAAMIRDAVRVREQHSIVEEKRDNCLKKRNYDNPIVIKLLETVQYWCRKDVHIILKKEARKRKRRIIGLAEREVYRAANYKQHGRLNNLERFRVLDMRRNEKKLRKIKRERSFKKRAGNPPVSNVTLQKTIERAADRAAKAVGRRGARTAAKRATKSKLVSLNKATARGREELLTKVENVPSKATKRPEKYKMFKVWKKKKGKKRVPETGNKTDIPQNIGFPNPPMKSKQNPKMLSTDEQSSTNEAKDLKNNTRIKEICETKVRKRVPGTGNKTEIPQSIRFFNLNVKSKKNPMTLSTDEQSSTNEQKDLKNNTCIKEICETKVRKSPKQSLVRSHNNENKHRTRGESPLHFAAFTGSPDKMSQLLKTGADMTHVDKYGSTPLHISASMGHDECLQLLLTYSRTCLHYKDHEGRTPLHGAAWNGHDRCIKLLLANGADVNVKDTKFGLSALHGAALNGWTDCMLTLIANGADITSLDGRKRTPLHVSAWFGKAESISILINHGVNVDSRCISSGGTALHLSAFNGHAECISLLLSKGAEVNSVDAVKFSALHIAAGKGYAECVRTLLQHGAKIDLVDERGNSALHLAGNGGHLKCVQLLLDADTSMN